MISPINIKAIYRQVKCLLLGFVLVFFIAPVFAQVKNAHVSHELKQFNKELVDADLTFTLPPGFNEIKPSGNDNQSFNYGIQLPDSNFEIWFQVKSLKPARLKNDKLINVDSLYLDMGRAQATNFIGDNHYMSRSIPPRSLARYNADAGKTFLLNLPDSRTTKHYKYAMVVVLQKNHSGTLMATCFANELGPGFFKNLNMASSCIKFNQ